MWKFPSPANKKIMGFKDDSLESIYEELQPIEAALEACGKEIKRLAVIAAEARAEYERLKNNELIDMYAYEAEKKIKRTEAHRTAIYRSKYSDARLAANLAEHQLKAERDFLSSLQAKLMSVQSRAKLLAIDKGLAAHS